MRAGIVEFKNEVRPQNISILKNLERSRTSCFVASKYIKTPKAKRH